MSTEPKAFAKDERVFLRGVDDLPGSVQAISYDDRKNAIYTIKLEDPTATPDGLYLARYFELRGDTEFVNLGDVCRKRLGQQAQYGCRWSETIAKGLRYTGSVADYHSMEIHRDDVDEFVRLVTAARS